jgi:hypothetical protein
MARPQLLWRHVLQATIDTLEGRSRGQYHIGLARPAGIEDFFAGLRRTSHGTRGGYDVDVPLEAYAGDDPVPAQVLPVSFIGPHSARRDWRIRSQRPDTAYPLFRLGRGLRPGTRPGADYILLVRDPGGRYHARWLHGERLRELPVELQGTLAAREAGHTVLDAETFAGLARVIALPAEPAGGPVEPPAERRVGGAYRRASGAARPRRRTEVYEVDPDVVDRGTHAHQETQDALADVLADNGVEPRSPEAADPPFDLAWEGGDAVFVAEVKSLSDENEERQLRLGLGQVLRYAHQLRQARATPVRPVLAAERRPSDGSWLDLCAELGVVLVWPESFASVLDEPADE